MGTFRKWTQHIHTTAKHTLQSILLTAIECFFRCLTSAAGGDPLGTKGDFCGHICACRHRVGNLRSNSTTSVLYPLSTSRSVQDYRTVSITPVICAFFPCSPVCTKTCPSHQKALLTPGTRSPQNLKTSLIEAPPLCVALVQSPVALMVFV
ncbi:Hypothetical predicted protein [Podarcis lilfordi]|uniref:Uncharacterized protein n=1 Tax=Podarcis lilfordi TaxID=74358 RepID=A0AA35JY64_9SAUR|nr:Hypothetical predicted protein [Podarcis lilfordi]